MRGPHNLGIKVRDLDAELAFLSACGATGSERGIVHGPAGERHYATTLLFGQRLLMFTRLIFEPAFPEPLPPGLSHAVFETDDVAALLARVAAHGVAPLWGPRDLDTPFGPRRVVFLRSPSGFVLEAFQPLEPYVTTGNAR